MTTRDIMIDQIDKLMDEEFMTIEIKKHKLSIYFQNNMDMTDPVFPDRLMAIMNIWARISVNNAKSKMLHVLQRVVSREVDTKVVELLIELYERQNRIPNTTDLYNALKRTHTILWYSNWNMNDKLLVEAENWVRRDGVTLLKSDFLSLIERTVHGKSQVLPDNFQHEINWKCSICIEVDADMPTCVRTTCNHIFHKTCLESWNCAYLSQECNNKKIYVPCPSCRGDVLGRVSI